MSEDYISLDIRPSYLEELTDLIEQEIVRQDDFNEIEKFFYILQDVEEEYYEAKHKMNEEYKKHRDTQHNIRMLRQYIKENEEPPIFITKDEDYIDKYHDFIQRMDKWTFCELFALFLVWDGRVTKDEAKQYIGGFEAWRQEKDNQKDTKIDYW